MSPDLWMRLLSMCAVLLRYSREVDCVTERGLTPLHLACQPFIPCFNKSEIIELLLSHGANVNARDGTGKVRKGGSPGLFRPDDNQQYHPFLLLCSGAHAEICRPSAVPDRDRLHVVLCLKTLKFLTDLSPFDHASDATALCSPHWWRI